VTCEFICLQITTKTKHDYSVFIYVNKTTVLNSLVTMIMTLDVKKQQKLDISYKFPADHDILMM